MKLKAKRSLFLYKKGYHRPPSDKKAIAIFTRILQAPSQRTASHQTYFFQPLSEMVIRYER